LSLVLSDEKLMTKWRLSCDFTKYEKDTDMAFPKFGDGANNY